MYNEGIMRFEVPQFINIEDKLFGPFTFKQAVYLGGAAGVIFLINQIFPLFVTIILGIPIAAFSLALTFYKPNGRPFIIMVESFMVYTFNQKFYLWQQENVTMGAADVKEKPGAFPKEGEAQTVNQNRLNDLAWSLDILDFDENA